MQYNFWWAMPLILTVYSFMITIDRHDNTTPFGKPSFCTELYNTARYILAFIVSSFIWYVYFIILKGQL